LRIGSVAGGYAARALARYAAAHCGRTPSLIWRACALARSILLPIVVRDQKTKAAKRKRAAFFFLPLFEIRKQKRLKENVRFEFSLARLSANCLRRKSSNVVFF